jgi:EAL domain-containing protein (putative c-di-GMP-specific phosphodiesterase class I)
MRRSNAAAVAIVIALVTLPFVELPASPWSHVFLVAVALALLGAIELDPTLTMLRVRRAIRRGEIEVWYQPKVSIPGGEVTAVEALVRWRHPRRGMIPPAKFIDGVEASFGVKRFNLWVVRQVCLQIREWLTSGYPPIVCVNISAQCFSDTGLADEIEAVAWETGVAPQLIDLEVTERALSENEVHAAENARKLSEAGFRLMLDDFGIGYSSLRRLVELPLAGIKIDRTFVTKMDTNEKATAVVMSATELAHTLDLIVIAEGVETESVWYRLAELGVDRAQGYLIAQPMPLPELMRWMQYEGAPFRSERRKEERRVASMTRTRALRELGFERRAGFDRRQLAPA